MYNNNNNNTNSNNNSQVYRIPPPPNPYPQYTGQPYVQPLYQPIHTHRPYAYDPNNANKPLKRRRQMPNTINNEPPVKRPKQEMSAHQLLAQRLSQQQSNRNKPISIFSNPYELNQKIQVRESELSHWLDGTIIELGYDWINVHYQAFSKKFDTTIYVDPNHRHSNKYNIRIRPNNIKNEHKNDTSDNNKNDIDINMAANNKTTVQQLITFVNSKRDALNQRKYNNVLHDIRAFLDGFNINNIPQNKYQTVAELYVIYALCLAHHSDHTQAIKYAKKSIKLSPKYYKGYATLAQLYADEDKYTAARKQYEFALKLSMPPNKRRDIQRRLRKINMSDSDTESDSDSDNEPIKKEVNDSYSDSESDSEEPIVNNKDSSKGVKGTTLDERVIDTKLMSAAQSNAYKNRGRNPNGFYYRFNEPGEKQANGEWSAAEHKVFMQRVKTIGVNLEWGCFSRGVEGRVGYQCSNYWRKLADDGWVKDENYVIVRKNGKDKRKQLNKKAVVEAGDGSDDYFNRFRRFQFTVIEDPSGTFKNLPCTHANAPNGGGRKRKKKKKIKKIKKERKRNSKKSKKKKREKKSKSKRKRKRLDQLIYILDDSDYDYEADGGCDGYGMSSEISCEEMNENTDNIDRKQRKKRVKKEMKKVKKEKNKVKIEESGQDFLCPISYEIMEDPVIVKQSGWTYERCAIESWIKHNGNDPNTRQECTLDDLIPNRTLRDAIVRWTQNVGLVKTEK